MVSGWLRQQVVEAEVQPGIQVVREANLAATSSRATEPTDQLS
jgi:hypothetical protein